MATLISFISRKGGTGKSTNAVNLAATFYDLGLKTILVETDTNYTLSTVRKINLHKQGANPNKHFRIFGSEDELVLEDVEKLRETDRPDVVIVDSAGKTTTAPIRRLALHSDLVLVPSSLSQNDLLVTYQTVQDLKPATEHNAGVRLAVLPNQLNSRTSPKTIAKNMEQLQVPVLKHFLPKKNVFVQYDTLSYEPEYEPIAREVAEMLGLKLKNPRRPPSK